MIPLGTPASAGSTHGMAMRATSYSDHPRVSGDRNSTMADPQLESEPLCRESIEGVIAA